MTAIELGTFVLLACVSAFGFWRLSRHQTQRELEAGRDPRSSTHASAAASTLLAMKIDPLVGAGTVIYMPVGDGLYMQRTSAAKARAWQRTLKEWMRRGATLNVIVTLPNAEARAAWQPLEKAFPRLFHYIELERASAPPDIAEQIARLDIYHPVLVVNATGPAAPGAMWIEQYHPPGSAHAYAVQYVAPAETQTDERFGIFLALYHRLLEGAYAHAGTQPEGQLRQAA